MAAVKEIYGFLDQLAPFATQMDFDNAGFLVGRGAVQVERLLVALDITEEVAEEAAELGCQLIVSHHPVIFHPARSVTDETVTGRVLLGLAEQRIAAICAHTNLDAAQGGVNDCLAAALELTEVGQLHQDGVDGQGRPYGIGRVGIAHRPGLTAGEYAAFVKEKLGAASVRFAGGGRPVQTVAVGGGSCGSMLADALAAGCDTFVTADVKYDQYLEAKALGITLMDAGHYATENVACAPLAQQLARKFPEVEVLLSQRHKEVYEGV
ncbi:Nif3-like dinuclear metal center hexameric protein [Pseudoflavonifractor phocaeensis]|uniref:Nif3-like dinuclear metal center hexameric protein n=1 Tax=Pseudoflavonifractor phocaeensis TaxID=1870988 RepID=UPI001F00D263|nr:Nif3-like dinuclear metal center hexameric protein [Pseudoflavonifractor phocaeensis]MCF2661065.1 Nif3-like dinuclear metal center hexameric protein [Pseudoflavonifractor phocaeensis]